MCRINIYEQVQKKDETFSHISTSRIETVENVNVLTPTATLAKVYECDKAVEISDTQMLEILKNKKHEHSLKASSLFGFPKLELK